MYSIKESSTANHNRKVAITKCPVAYTLDKIGGRWKALIIFNLLNGPVRYGALKRSMPAITEKMLIQQLKELEADQLVTREVKPVVPPHVTYSLTEAGNALGPVFEAMALWGIAFNNAETETDCTMATMGAMAEMDAMQ